MIRCTCCVLFSACFALAAQAGEPASRPGIDAPELAQLGSYAVGISSELLVDRAQFDALAFDPKTGRAAKRDRPLAVDIWYPAEVTADATPEIYAAELPAEPPAPPAHFTIQGLAVRDARPAAGRFPLVVLSHGYSNVTIALSWLTENLASKGYVVAAIHHDDPTITDPRGLPQLLLRRPLDIAFVTRQLQAKWGAQGRIDPARIALIGYSMGGYGVLSAAGAELDPDSEVAHVVPGGLLGPYVRGGGLSGSLHVAGLKATVAMAPAGGEWSAWGRDGLRQIRSPLLLIAGDHDQTVDYQSGARAFFEQASGAPRYLLTYKQGGHAIGFGPAPPEMRRGLWNLDWFEDVVWRKERLIGINQHFITAFLDRYVKDDLSRSAYLDGLVEDSDAAVWPASESRKYDEFSAGRDSITVWRGFQRRHAVGLRWQRRAADAR